MAGNLDDIRDQSRAAIHAKFALPSGGMPYSQRGSSLSLSPPQSDMLNGGLARM